MSEAENEQKTKSIRAQGVAIPPLRCKLGVHKWGLWGDKFQIRESKFMFEYQQRKCLCCGFVDERRI